jgi:hypothetical protein
MEAGVEESEFISISHKGFAEIAKVRVLCVLSLYLE